MIFMPSLLVYDITNRESYEALASWFAERGTHVPESTVKIIIGNKADKVCSTSSPSFPTLFLWLITIAGACATGSDGRGGGICCAHGLFVCRDVSKDCDWCVRGVP